MREEVADLRQRLREATAASAPAAIPTEMLKRLISLGHPDKHGSSEPSNVATAACLLQQRQERR
ncbi:conserved hypothetical protein [Candidatus Accumulibacter aalborgensis]|uniref:Uncharacterized protein n=1 Tax=Candidatus Accumulibacter aalborgensis TaxID=1860102 RepID=A0A1A8XYR3_9PROT|nr:hypothetical protein [Candidatus Accumulibacter aalborgensis]SBT09841.1 conserved hypothetical protein [Candidatus Accumulibacter aalborgensis]